MQRVEVEWASQEGRAVYVENSGTDQRATTTKMETSRAHFVDASTRVEHGSHVSDLPRLT
jgi:hypothetical protein